MKQRLILWLVLNVFLPTLSLAQGYPTLKGAHIHVAIEHHLTDSLYYYAFSLANGITSEGTISSFEIDISRDVSSLDADTTGIRFEDDGIIEASFRRHFPFLKGKIIPVGLLSSPGNSHGFTWSGDFSNDLTSGWTADSACIEPGDSLGGFTMVSKGLPGIRRCIVSPFFNFDRLFSRERFPTDEDMPNTDSIQNAVKFYGWTVGPTSPPVSFISSDVLDTLISYTNLSRSLGWIPTQATSAKYITYFDSAKSLLKVNKTAQACAILQSVLRDVDVDRSSRLASEAHALIRYNTEYLLARLSTTSPSRNMDRR
jgi:hypothetical protein